MVEYGKMPPDRIRQAGSDKTALWHGYKAGTGMCSVQVIHTYTCTYIYIYIERERER